MLPSDYDFDAHKELVPMQAGDVPVTFADATPLEQDFGFDFRHHCVMVSVHLPNVTQGISELVNNIHHQDELYYSHSC